MSRSDRTKVAEEVLPGDVLLEVPGEFPGRLLLENPEKVEAFHRECLNAGARILCAASGHANRALLEAAGLGEHLNEINWTAAQLVNSVVKSNPQFRAKAGARVFGLPAETASSQREGCYVEQIGALLDGGVRLLLLENFETLQDLILAAQVKQSLHHCPAVGFLNPASSSFLPPGCGWKEALARMEAEGVEAAGLQLPAEESVSFLELRESFPEFLQAVSISVASPARTGGDDFATTAMRAAQAGFSMIFGGAGVSLEDLGKFSQLLRNADGGA